MGGAAQGGYPRLEGEGVHVEGILDLEHRGDDLASGDREAEPQPRHSVDLREGPQEDEPPVAFPYEGQDLGEARVVGEVGVGLVHHDEDGWREAREELGELGPADEGPRGVVGIADEDGLGPFVDRRPHRDEVVAEPRLAPHRNGTGIGEEAHRLVDAEGRTGQDDLVARREEGLGEDAKHVVEAVADEEVRSLDLQRGREGLLEVEGVRVGIYRRFSHSQRYRAPHLVRGAEGVLVRGHLDRPADPELPLQLLDRLAGDVGGEPEDCRADEVLNVHA